MALNQIFASTLQGGTANNEATLLDNLIVESLRIYGFNVKYLPRTIVREDTLFGGDDLSIFDDAMDIEVYIKNVNGFDGEGDFLSRFGLQIRDQITFTVSRKRFLQSRDENLVSEYGRTILQEDGNELQLENATGNNYALTLTRPREGDLIFFPLNNKLFEIKFVEHEDVFYQLGHLYTWDMQCELFDYNSERLDTDHSEVDAIETEFSLDILDAEIVQEDNFRIVLEQGGGSIIQESEKPELADPQANNDVFTLQTQANNVIDYSESSPFGPGKFW